jgi:hypothetical protein
VFVQAGVCAADPASQHLIETGGVRQTGQGVDPRQGLEVPQRPFALYDDRNQPGRVAQKLGLFGAEPVRRSGGVGVSRRSDFLL